LKKMEEGIEASMSDSERKKFKKMKKEISVKTNKQLQALLRFNNMKVTGLKAQLIDRVAEGMAVGVVQKCSVCGGGNPNFDKGFWICSGYMDDTDFQSCSFAELTVPREPWKEGEEEK